MIFQRTIIKECSLAAVIVLTVLSGITATTLLIRFLGEAASGNLPSESVFMLLVFSILNYLPILLSLTVFMAVLIVVSRSYRESEMIIWMSGGVSLWRWINPVLYFSFPVILIIAALSFYVAPWAEHQSEEYRHQLENKEESNSIATGVFRESKQHDKVYFIESFAGSLQHVRNIFMQSDLNGQLGIVSSYAGYQERNPKTQDLFLVFQKGHRYEGVPGQSDYKIISFEKYKIRVRPAEDKIFIPSVKALSTSFLYHHPDSKNQAELVWRAGVPMSTVLLSLAAILLGFINPRVARSMNLFVAVLIYMTYSNLVSIVQAQVAQEKLSFLTGMWALHLVMLCLVLGGFYLQIYGLPQKIKKLPVKK